MASALTSSPPLALADGEIPDDFGHLIDVARAQLLDVVLEAATPVGGHLRLVFLQNVEDLLDLVLADDGAETDLLAAFDRDHQCEVAVRDAELEVLPPLSQELPHAELFDDCCTMLWMDNRIALTKHKTPSDRWPGRNRMLSQGSTGGACPANQKPRSERLLAHFGRPFDCSSMSVDRTLSACSACRRDAPAQVRASFA